MGDLKIGITLSGGGARGLAHVGVLQALEDFGIIPSIVSGASAGSIVGALYASGLAPKNILKVMEKSQSLLKIFNFGIPKQGLSDLSYLENILKDNIKDLRFEAMKKELFIAVSNLNSAQVEYMNSGDLKKAVVASSSIPLIFKPIDMNGNRYVDGGLMDNFPVKAIRDSCDFLIGVNVMPLNPMSIDNLESLKDIGMRSFEMSVWNNTQPNIPLCDAFIEPTELSKYHIFAFKKYQIMYDIGYQTTFAKIAKIESLIKKKKVELAC